MNAKPARYLHMFHEVPIPHMETISSSSYLWNPAIPVDLQTCFNVSSLFRFSLTGYLLVGNGKYMSQFSVKNA